MIALEQHHNTADQVASYLAGALAVVTELELEGELRELAFTKAVDLLSAKTIQVVPDGVQVARPNGLGVLRG